MGDSRGSHDHHSTIEDSNDEQLGIVTTELMNSDLPIRQIPRVQAFINGHENLQPDLQAMAPINPLVARLNSQQRANIDTFVDSLDSMRSLGRICSSLQRESLSQEAAEIVNTEGGNLINNVLNICSRTGRELHQNSLVLREAIVENERTTNDPVIQQLVQEQLQITANISGDPREAVQQMRRVVTIDNQLQEEIERVEPNADATVRTVAQNNSRYLKYAFGAFFLAAAVVAMCAGIPYLIPIVTSVVNLASPSSSATMSIIPAILAFVKPRLS